MILETMLPRTKIQLKLGSNLTQDGCYFKVWAPNATKVSVVGEFNNWNKHQNFLEKNGEYWQGFVLDPNFYTNAQRLKSLSNDYEYNNTEYDDIAYSNSYKYVFWNNDDGNHFMTDPAARETKHSAIDGTNYGVIIDTNFNWCNYSTPKFENFNIYQLHPGTFAGYNDSHIYIEPNIPAKFKQLESKLGYIRDLGFNAIQLLPVQEFMNDRSWGYNPSYYFSIESAYGTPHEFRKFVDKAHQIGLAVIVDVVYNHISDASNYSHTSLYNVDLPGYNNNGIYLHPEYTTEWGPSFNFWSDGVKHFFSENIAMYFDEYNCDGIRFDATRDIEKNRGYGSDGWNFIQHLMNYTNNRYPEKYTIAEHMNDDKNIINNAGFDATWRESCYHDFLKAAKGDDSINKIKGLLGKDFNGHMQNYDNQWNLVKYLMGSHDKCGDDNENGRDESRFFVTQFRDSNGGDERENWYIRAKARIAWALNVSIMGTPMIFAGNECYKSGYWHDFKQEGGYDPRFNWEMAGDTYGMQMRAFVKCANAVRWNNEALRSETLDITHEDYNNSVIAFKRYVPGGDNTVLVIVNIGNNEFQNREYKVKTGGQHGKWEQILSSQDREFGGYDKPGEESGNAFYQPETDNNCEISINLPKYSVVVMKLI